MPLDTADLNHLWASLLVEELVRQGVTFFSVSPGSRSTPLALAIARRAARDPSETGSLDYAVHFDERGSLFLALGHARATGRPAAWLTTSGTAAANGYPAVVEADVDGVPLVLLTADRPPELRQTGANQTIDQVKLFGDRVRWFFDLPAPASDVDAAFVLTTAAQAAFRARVPHPGPVHLNVPFREPLSRPADAPDVDVPESLRAWHSTRLPYTRHVAPAPAADVSTLADRLRGVARGLVIAGRLRSRAEGEAAARLAQHLGWPLLPDVLSQVRLGADDAAIPHYDLLLASEGFAEAQRPDAVVLVGDLPVSKRLLTFLHDTHPPIFATLGTTPNRLDPFHTVTDALAADVSTTADALVARLPARRTDAWRAAWQQGDQAVRRVLEAHAAGPTLTEPGVARLVTQLAPAGEALFLAASMPVRDADAFGTPDGAALRVAANRGASGIDGTVASALGFARGADTGATLLIGDLALLHDLNSLALCARAPRRLVIVCLNNDGGGIFSFLPVSQHAPAHFETLFGTPHGLRFADAARQFGLEYAAPDTPEAFEAAYRSALAHDGCTLIEVATDRAANAELHRALVAEVRAALEP